MPKIVQNAIELPDGTILLSRTTHDYQSKDGYFVDGGKDYIRCGYPDNCENKFKPLFLDKNSTLDELKRKSVWGTYGMDGNNFHWVRLINCDINHLKNILVQQKLRSAKWSIRIIESILEDRHIKKRIKKIKKLINAT